MQCVHEMPLYDHVVGVSSVAGVNICLGGIPNITRKWDSGSQGLTLEGCI